ncbi:hypothetical protein B2G88_04390 [Natronolimnobius baerhuensis]|uniref:DUF7344 domain-containing protein n=1 Tax=Natronolimnobius baerhuensis TaxID=253108 RepID=A0A202ECT2_9EURY|nr:hypothetical protein B2G88_04390 [Natronolimnobius baerhuensis]
MNNQYGSVEDLRQAALDHSIDDILRLCSRPHVRTVIAALYSRPDTTLEQLSTVCAGSVAVTDDRLATQQDFDQIQRQLYHATLPRLEEFGWITFDHETGTVKETGIPDAMYTFLGVDETE